MRTPIITPQLHLETLFLLDAAGRIVSTREPQPSPGPVFSLVRSADCCAWAIRADTARDLADELERLVREEPPVADFREPPIHAERYVALIGGAVRSGPAFSFPQNLVAPSGLVTIEDEQPLRRHFRGWSDGEIKAGRMPMLAVVEGGEVVSVCFSSRWSPVAAEAGVETAEGFQGRGFGAWVTAGWALAVRSAGRIPLYSTYWSNAASLGLARKLNLEMYAAQWSVRHASEG